METSLTIDTGESLCFTIKGYFEEYVFMSDVRELIELLRETLKILKTSGITSVDSITELELKYRHILDEDYYDKNSWESEDSW